MHFLVEIPRTNSSTPENRQPEWLKWGFFLTWLPTRRAATYTVALIVFEPPVETLERLLEFVRSPNWTDVTVDPYVLVDIALVSWYHRVDKVAWEVTNLIRNDERDIFGYAQKLQSNEWALDLHQIHTNAKNAIFMLEALDAAIRQVDMALLEHKSIPKQGEKLWENTHRLLRHRLELFQSTKLRTTSSQARIKNTIDLVRTLADQQQPP
jgi:hypothetical protein